MNVSPTAQPNTPAIARNQSLQPQQANQTQPQSRLRRTLQTLLPCLPLAPRQQTNPRPSQREQLVDYATRAAVNLDPLNQGDLRSVNVSTEAMYKTRAMLPFRGNVNKDLLRSGGGNMKSADVSAYRLEAAREAGEAAYYGLEAAREAEEKLEPMERTAANVLAYKERTAANVLAYNVKMGVGNCGEFASLTARNVSSQLLPGQTASVAKLTSTKPNGKLVDHVVAKINPRPGSGNSEIIADAWANGVAVRTKDAPLTMQGPVKIINNFTPMQGRGPLTDISAIANLMPASYETDMNARAKEIFKEKNYTLKTPGIFNEIQTTSQKFENDSKAAAIKVLKVEGPRNQGQAAVESVEGDPDLDGAASVNTMVKQLAKELGISKYDTQGIQGVADQVAKTVRNIALKDRRPKDDEWVNIQPLPNPPQTGSARPSVSSRLPVSWLWPSRR